MKSLVVFTCLLYFYYPVAILAQPSEFNEREFFEAVKTSYYTMEESGVKNFTASVTSLTMENFAQDSWDNKEIFPIQMIWFHPDKIYLAQQGVPTLAADKFKEFQDIVNGIKQQLRGLIIDLQRFYFGGLYREIPDNYNIRNNDKIVEISYETEENGQPLKYVYIFGRNGLCLGIESIFQKENKKIVTYPEFSVVKTKWICKGWKVQQLENGEVKSGYSISLNNSTMNEIWVPVELVITAQNLETQGSTYVDVIRLRNFLFNQQLEIMQGPN